MRPNESNIEVKVGALVLAAVAILIAFVLVLGDVSFKKGYPIYVDFDNAAGLKAGAPVRIAGIPSGTVKAVEYQGGVKDPKVEWPVYVRATLWLDESARGLLRENASFTITTQGVLGEPYVEVNAGDPAQQAVPEGEIFKGVDPPRMDMLLSSAYRTIGGLQEVIERLNGRGEKPIHIDEFVNNIGKLAGSLDERVTVNKEEIDSIVANVDGILKENRQAVNNIFGNAEQASAEFNRLGHSLNNAVGDGQNVRSLVRNADRTVASIARDIDPMVEHAKGALASADGILSGNRTRIDNSIANVERLTLHGANAAEDIETMVDGIAAGNGTIGKFLKDEEIFEDMREFVRELKRRPWRIIWKE
jgi:phospholipid/cholesterol/gamma-HCH transport system substrate-binding protein